MERFPKVLLRYTVVSSQSKLEGEKISLSDYENHMKLDSVMRLQGMNQMVKGQLDAYPVSSVIILGIAGGNGLEHIDKSKFQKVYGIDINSKYLKTVKERYSDISDILECMRLDLIQKSNKLLKAESLIQVLNSIEYKLIGQMERLLPNGKKLVQLDFFL